MNAGKLTLVILAGLGSTWAARAATEALFGIRPPARLLLAAEPAAAGEPAPSGAAGASAADQPAGPQAGSTPGKAPPPDLSRDEMEAEMKHAAAELAGRPSEEELREFRPTKPLAADLPIALPSDM